MSTGKERTPKKLSRKKQVQQEITEALKTALAHFKETIGEKKFERRITRAAKLFSAGIKEKKAKEKP